MRDFKILGSISNKLNAGKPNYGGKTHKVDDKSSSIFNANEFNDWRQKRERSSVVSSKYLSLYVMIFKNIFSNGK